MDSTNNETVDDSTVNCWEHQGCPEDVRSTCPAYPHLGRQCWKVTGSRCALGRHEKSSLSEKITYCINSCTFCQTFCDCVQEAPHT